MRISKAEIDSKKAILKPKVLSELFQASFPSFQVFHCLSEHLSRTFICSNTILHLRQASRKI